MHFFAIAGVTILFSAVVFNFLGGVTFLRCCSQSRSLVAFPRVTVWQGIFCESFFLFHPSVSPPAAPPQVLACDQLEQSALLAGLEVFLILSHGILKLLGLSQGERSAPHPAHCLSGCSSGYLEVASCSWACCVCIFGRLSLETVNAYNLLRADIF